MVYLSLACHALFLLYSVERKGLTLTLQLTQTDLFIIYRTSQSHSSNVINFSKLSTHPLLGHDADERYQALHPFRVYTEIREKGLRGYRFWPLTFESPEHLASVPDLPDVTKDRGREGLEPRLPGLRARTGIKLI